MKKTLSFFIVMASLAMACNSDSKSLDKEDDESTTERSSKKKNPMDAMAADICDCMTPLTRSLSKDARRVFEKALKSDDPETTTREEISKLDEEEQTNVAAEIEVVASAFQKEDSQVNACMNKVSKKYKDEPDDPKKAMKQLIDAMEGEDDCELGALIFKAYMAKGMNETENNDTNNQQDDDDPAENEQ